MQLVNCSRLFLRMRAGDVTMIARVDGLSISDFFSRKKSSRSVCNEIVRRRSINPNLCCLRGSSMFKMSPDMLSARIMAALAQVVPVSQVAHHLFDSCVNSICEKDSGRRLRCWKELGDGSCVFGLGASGFLDPAIIKHSTLLDATSTPHVLRLKNDRRHREG